MGGMFGSVSGNVAASQYGEAKPGAGYTNPRDSVGSPYVSSYTPQTATPFLQSVMSQHSGSPLQQSNSLGLPSLQSMFNMPQNGSPLQTSGIQQLATMAPYISSAYRPDMSGATNRLNFAAPSVRPEQVSELDVYGKPIIKDVPVDSGSGG